MDLQFEQGEYMWHCRRRRASSVVRQLFNNAFTEID